MAEAAWRLRSPPLATKKAANSTQVAPARPLGTCLALIVAKNAHMCAAAGDNRRAVGHMLERERGGAFSLTPSKLLSDFNSLGNFGAESRRMLLLLQLVAKASSLDVGLHNDFMHMLDELGVPVLSRVVELSKPP